MRILVLPQNSPLKLGDYPINLSEGLEDALVEAFKPQCNKIKGKLHTETQAREESANLMDCLRVRVSSLKPSVIMANIV